jgi:hypothetical protein
MTTVADDAIKKVITVVSSIIADYRLVKCSLHSGYHPFTQELFNFSTDKSFGQALMMSFACSNVQKLVKKIYMRMLQSRSHQLTTAKHIELFLEMCLHHGLGNALCEPKFGHPKEMTTVDGSKEYRTHMNFTPLALAIHYDPRVALKLIELSQQRRNQRVGELNSHLQIQTSFNFAICSGHRLDEFVEPSFTPLYYAAHLYATPHSKANSTSIVIPANAHTNENARKEKQDTMLTLIRMLLQQSNAVTLNSCWTQFKMIFASESRMFFFFDAARLVSTFLPLLFEYAHHDGSGLRLNVHDINIFDRCPTWKGVTAIQKQIQSILQKRRDYYELLLPVVSSMLYDLYMPTVLHSIVHDYLQQKQNTYYNFQTRSLEMIR